MSRRKEPVIPPDVLNRLLAGGDAAAALKQGGLLDSLKKALAELALKAEMDHYPGLGTRSKPATAAMAMAARPWPPTPGSLRGGQV